MPLYNQIAGFNDTPVINGPGALSGPAQIGSFFGDAFKAVQHVAAGMGMQVPRASFLGLVALNAFGYANKLDRALQHTDTREKLEDLWWRLGGAPDKLREAIYIGRTKPAATQVSGGDQTQQLRDLALQGGTYRDAQGILHDINSGAVVGGTGNRIGIVPVVAAAAISSAAIIVAAILPVITRMLDAKNVTVPGLPIDPNTGLPVGYTDNSIQGWIAANPMLAALAAAVGVYIIYENV